MQTEKPVMKALKVKLKPNQKQRKFLDEWLHTSRFVYNKTIHAINTGAENVNFYNLRDKYVTTETKKNTEEYGKITTLYEQKKKLIMKHKECQRQLQENIHSNEKIQSANKKQQGKKRTTAEKKNQLQQECIALEQQNIAFKQQHEIKQKKFEKQLECLDALIDKSKKHYASIRSTLEPEKNDNIKDWEIQTPKDIRAGAVEDVCKAHKTGMANLKAKNIKFFILHYRKKVSPRQSMVIPKSAIKNKNGIIQIYPSLLKTSFPMGKRTIKKHKELTISSDCRLIRENRVYWLMIPVPVVLAPIETQKETEIRFCGIDPGVRTLFTIFEKDGCSEYNHREELWEKLDTKIRYLKSQHNSSSRRVLKRKISKVERKKLNVTNELHWKTIHSLLKRNNVIFFGDIKSHNIVRGGKNCNLNRKINNLKFYQYKQRLMFKAAEKRRLVYMVNEAYTTQTCSCCGALNQPKLSKRYNCLNCKSIVGRDVNAAKNILMRGLMCLPQE
jgi:IS605 OrfB family transposase